MADIPRTRTLLIGTDFVTGQSAGIGSDDARNLIVSIAPHYAAVDPTVTDDINAASPGPYGIGCIWVNTSTGARFICKDNTDGAAVWKNVVGVYFLEGESTASPNGTVSVDSLKANGAATNIDLAIVPKGTGALLVQIPDSTATGGNKRGTYAVDLQQQRDTAAKVASGNSAVLAGGRYNTASGAYAALGGGNGNTVSGNTCVVGGGESNLANNLYNVVGGGQSNTASGSVSTVGGGSSNLSSGDYSSIPGGNANTASGAFSCASGTSALANKYGQSSEASGAFSVQGDAQTSTLKARNSTTNATPTELFLNGSSLRCTIPTDTTWAFTITVVGRRTDANDESFGQIHSGVIDNNAGTVAIAGTIVNVPLANDTVFWASAVTADNTNDALVITVTGENSKTIRWVARIELTEVTG